MSEDDGESGKNAETKKSNSVARSSPSVELHWVAILAGSSGGLAVGASVGLTSVLIPSLQDERDENITLDLEQGSWLGEWKMLSYWELHKYYFLHIQ